MEEKINLEVTVVLYGILHGLGGASVAVNLGMMAYIGDIATHETKVSEQHFLHSYNQCLLRDWLVIHNVFT
jgi:hypothetical protein